jgi:2-polyprenyl-6-hydroxyphenyl methylase/3-demethylubiquinone-9 3-methyltransferase
VAKKKTGAEMKESTDTASASAPEFVRYYEAASVTPATLERFNSVKATVGRMLALDNSRKPPLSMLDIGCGAGTQCILWARDGHRVHGIDISAELIDVGIARAREISLPIDLRSGTATDLPWPDASMDVCLLPELLEHVAAWEKCLDEAVRVLKPGGVLYASTTNSLCPKQDEFDVPFYSWFPGPIKRRYEQLAVTTRPELVNHAKYPAVNWFTFGKLRRALDVRAVDCRDRFEVGDTDGRGATASLVVGLLKRSAVARSLARFVTPYTIVLGVKR